MTIPNGISPVDGGVLSSFFNSNGYVLGFSTSSFDQFTSQSIGVALCSLYGLSKGKSLEAFTAQGEVGKVVKLYDDLIQYYEFHYAKELQENPARKAQLERLKRILDKYRPAGTTLASTPALERVTYAYIRGMSERAQRDIENGDFDSAITKSRTLLEEVFCAVIEKRGKTPTRSGEIGVLYDQVKDLYHMHHDPGTDKRIHGLLSGLEQLMRAIAKMRNESSDSHGVGSRRINIKAHHARLFVNSAQTMADFILAVSEAAA